MVAQSYNPSWNKKTTVASATLQNPVQKEKQEWEKSRGGKEEGKENKKSYVTKEKLVHLEIEP